MHNFYVYNLLNPTYIETDEIFKRNGKEYQKRIYNKPPTLGQLKHQEDKLFLKEVDSLALCNTKLNFEKARNTFLSIKEHKLRQKVIKKLQNKSDYEIRLPYDFEYFPRFRRKTDKQSYTTNNQAVKYKKKDNTKLIAYSIDYQSRGKQKGYIKLPKIGYVKVNLNREFDGFIHRVTITLSKSGKYKISILVSKFNLKQQRLFNDGQVGIDLGIKSYIKDSNGNTIQNPKFLRKQEKKLKREQRKLSRRYKENNPTKNWEKQKIKVSKIYEKIQNQRNDFCQKLSTKYISENQVICLENLNIKGMMKNHTLAKSIQDCGWSMFVNMLIYKAKWYNRQIIKVDTFYPSTKTCNVCGYKNNELTLKDRFWTCPNCKTYHDRDANAAINILQEGLKYRRDYENSSLCYYEPSNSIKQETDCYSCR